MKNKSQLGRVMSTIAVFLAIAVVTYGFLSLVNWSPYLKEWNGFSRLILGFEGLAFLIKIWDEL